VLLEHTLLTRDLDAAPARRKAQAVVQATHRVALEPTARQRGTTVAAPISQRGGLAVESAKQHQRLADDSLLPQFTDDEFGGEACCLPGDFQEDGH